ncbi:MAG TPA: ATPase domain-containing protein [Candidatus Nanoarchaeia archaeon]|nr:ATPase domain-containing protein [Candidatus Nanoarchaeia archaeon]
MNNRIKTFIPGLDEMLKGGLREGTNVLITGSPGTGKTLLGIQFILEGAKNGDAGVYITCEETVEDIRDYAEAIGYNIRSLEKKGLVTLIKQPISAKKLMTIATPLSVIESKSVKRVVLDSITLFGFVHASGEMDYRKEVLDFVLRMKESKVNLLVISEKSISNIDNIRYDTEDFLFDGLIILAKIRKGASFERCVMISKMRGQDHLFDLFPFSIDKSGLKIFPKQMPFSLIEKDEKSRWQ